MAGLRGCAPSRVFSPLFRAKSGVAEGRRLQTSPQSGSGRKEQIKSKAAIRSCTQSFAQRVQPAYCQASDGGVEGVRPLARFLTAFSRKKAVSPKADAFRPHRRAAAAARSSPNRKPQQARLRRADALSYGC